MVTHDEFSLAVDAACTFLQEFAPQDFAWIRQQGAENRPGKGRMNPEAVVGIDRLDKDGALVQVQFVQPGIKAEGLLKDKILNSKAQQFRDLVGLTGSLARPDHGVVGDGVGEDLVGRAVGPQVFEQLQRLVDPTVLLARRDRRVVGGGVGEDRAPGLRMATLFQGVQAPQSGTPGSCTRYAGRRDSLHIVFCGSTAVETLDDSCVRHFSGRNCPIKHRRETVWPQWLPIPSRARSCTEHIGLRRPLHPIRVYVPEFPWTCHKATGV